MTILLRSSVLVWTCCVCVAVAGAESVDKAKKPVPQGAATPVTDPSQSGTFQKVQAKRLPKGAAAPVEGRARPAPASQSPTPTSTPQPLPTPMPAQFDQKDTLIGVVPEDGFAGTWNKADDPRAKIQIRSLRNGMYELRHTGEWDALGFFDGTEYWGLFRSVAISGGKVAQYGTHHGVRQPDGSLRVRGALQGAATDFEQIWTRAIPEARDPGEEAPRFGEYVYVEKLPEAVSKVEAVYPPEARNAGVEGTVLVQVLVGKDGRVQDTKIVKSIPMLDAAADAAVRQWAFKPALSNGQPVAAWVAVPIKFSRH